MLGSDQWWTLISALFLHADIGHLLSNSYMLFVLSVFAFGTLTQTLRGAFTLLLLLLMAGALVSFLTLRSYLPETRLVGISGVVYILAGFWLSNYVFIDRRRNFLARLIRVIGTALVVLFPTSFEKTTSYMAHFHGFWVGVLLGVGFFTLQRKQIRSYEEVVIEEDTDAEIENADLERSAPNLSE